MIEIVLSVEHDHRAQVRRQLDALHAPDLHARHDHRRALLQSADLGELRRQLEAARASAARLAVLDNPLLFEGRARRGPALAGSPSDPGGETVLVYAPAEVQIARQIARDGVTREFAEQRLAAQMPIEAKRALATWVIENGGALADTQRQVQALFARLVA